MTRLAACDDCLRRTDLVAAFAAWLDVEWRRAGPARVLALADDELIALDRSGRTAHRRATFSPPAARERIRASGLSAVCRCEPGYPAALRELADPPAVLHVAGRRRGARARSAASPSSARGAGRATASRSRARSAAGWPRRASPWSPASRSGSTRPPTSARSTRPRRRPGRGG